MELAPHPWTLGVLTGGAAGAWLGLRWLEVLWRRCRVWVLALAGVTFIAVMAGPVDQVAENRSVAAHVLQHMALFSLVPPLLVTAVKPALDRRSPVTTRQALVLLVCGVSLVVVWHLPSVMAATLESPLLNDASHLVVVVGGLCLTWPLLAPSPLPGLGAVLFLAAAEIAIGALGIWLTWSPEVLYAFYDSVDPPWGWDAKTDQAWAGAALLVIEEPLLAVEVAVLFIGALSDDDED